MVGSVAGPVATRRTDLPPLRQQSIRKQFSTLSRRYLSVIAADRGYLGILVALPILLAAISRIVPAPAGLGPGGDTANLKARQLLLIVILGATLMGAASAVREIVKERPIYQRERSIGLSSAAYLWSKVIVLAAIVTLQAVVLTVLALVGRKGASHPVVLGSSLLEIAVAVVVVTVVSAMLGLVISAWVSNADKAMPMLVLMIMIQLVFSGGLVPLGGRPGLEQASYVVPARWGFAMAASTTDLHNIEIFRAPAICSKLDELQSTDRVPSDLSGIDGLSKSDVVSINTICHHKNPRNDAIWRHDRVTWLGDLWVLMALGGVSVLVVAFLLKRLEPKRRVRQIGQVQPSAFSANGVGAVGARPLGRPLG